MLLVGIRMVCGGDKVSIKEVMATRVAFPPRMQMEEKKKRRKSGTFEPERESEKQGTY